MKEGSLVKNIIKYLINDLKQFLYICSPIIYLGHLVFTIAMLHCYMSDGSMYSQDAIDMAPYWLIGNIVLAFVSWIGYRIYQVVKNQKQGT